MKAALFSIFATATLLATAPSFAATAPAAAAFETYHDRDDRNSKDFNYGYDKKHRVTPSERARWEAAHRDDRRDDRRDKKDDRRDDRRDKKDGRRDDKYDRFDRNTNYGYDRGHRVTPQERARWEAAHRHDNRR